MALPLRVLLVEKDEEDLELIAQELERGGFEAEIHPVAIERDYLTQLEAGHDIIISNYALMQFDAIRALEILKEKGLDTPLIVIGGKVGEELAVECIKQGAADFLLKARLSRLGQVVKRVLQESKIEREKTQTEASLHKGASLYRQLLEFCPVGILLVEQGNVTFVNRSGAHLLGAASPKQLLEKSLAGFAHADSREDLEKRLQESDLESNKTTFLREKFVRLDGKEINLELEALLVTNSGHQAILLVMHDITEQERDQGLLPLYLNLLSQVPDAVVAVDDERKITYWNRSAEKMYEAPSDEVLGKKLDEVYERRWVDEEDEKASGEALAKSGFWRGKNIHVTKGGKEIHVSSSVRLIQDKTGKSSGMISIIRDLTQTRKTQDSLKKERNFYSSVLNAASGLLLVLDKEGRILLFNGVCEKLSGYSINEVRQKHPWDFLLSPEDSQSAEASFKGLKVDQFPYSHEDFWITKDATRRLISWSDTVLKDDKGEVACIVSTGIDITEQKEAEEADRQSAEYFRSLVENAADALLILDKDGIIRFENPSFEKILGYKPEEFLDKNLGELVHPDDAPLLSKALDGVKKRPDSTASMQLRLQSKQGLWVTVEGVSKNFLKDPAVSGIAVTVRDITRRKKTEQGIQRQLQTLGALHAIDIATSNGLDLRVTVKVILEQLITELGVDATSVLLFNPHTHKLKYFSGLGFRNIAISHSEINLGEGVAGKAGLERELIRIPDLRDSEEASRRAELLAEEEFVAYYAMPLVARGELKGVLEIFNRSALSPDLDWLDFLSAVSSQAAVAMDNADLIATLQRHNTGLGFAYDATLEGLSSALDLREQISSGHSQQLAEWTLKLGETVGMEGPDLINHRRGALMHDIGKIGVPESILLKPGPLSDKEWDTMHMHPRYAHRLLSDIPYLRSAVNIPFCHHEKWDGSGYPRGLKGKEIPLAARVFSVVGAWDVLGRDRPYREAWPNMKIREHLKSQSGIDFDPEIVEKFLELEREGAFTRDTPSKEFITLGETTQDKPVDERVEEKRTEAEPPKEVAAEPAEPKEEVTETLQEEVTEETTKETKGTVLEKLKGKVTEDKPVEERVEEKRTEAEPPKEVTAAEPAEPKEEVTEKPQEQVTEESKGTVLGKLKGKITESFKGKVSKEPEETVTEEPQATEPQEKVSPRKPEETGLNPKELFTQKKPKGSGLKFKEKVSLEEPEETSLNFKEKVSLEKPEESGLKFKEKVSPEGPQEIGPKLEEKVSPEEPKGTNSAPPMVFSEPLMGAMTQELNENEGEGKVTERLMGITSPEPLETGEKEGTET
ncbi:MAG: PAS domain S-box protein [Acidobacteriota bacterium]